ncbi:hypothetical protein L3X38_033614 [Prunus dulcis]|uniref:Uncharacterized protein n=1 Tax=Prunus dulcis TaxID=3755 RepID=A0AAD4VIE4_PRUDU|nr:hypothetical protein L3X38_033614 [Prunus dulcis]
MVHQTKLKVVPASASTASAALGFKLCLACRQCIIRVCCSLLTIQGKEVEVMVVEVVGGGGGGSGGGGDGGGGDGGGGRWR